ncbi:MAG: 23S rRNA (uracil(1939)-C(5))-methyltransferase RlmD [Lachnospiraceae bacterium]|nr:23S rRNA (uracil(1939)-C(5))-methyltransferase RlmD [Lachnospiraceae bacterium]
MQENKNRKYKKTGAVKPENNKKTGVVKPVNNKKTGAVKLANKKPANNKSTTKSVDKKPTNHSPRNNTCPYQKKCGGCDYIGIPYGKQLQMKQERIEKLLLPITRQSRVKVQPIVGADHPEYYRNKVHSVFAGAKGNRILRGIYEKNSHRVVDIKGCKLEDRTAGAIIEEIRNLMPSFRMKPYDEDHGVGFLRHVLVRVASSGIMVVLVTGEVTFPGKNNFVKALRKKFPEIETIVQNINNKQTSMVLGERNIILYGKGFVVDDRLGLSFRISPSAFFQINTEQTVKLYDLALQEAGLTGKETVLDAYCGTGTIGMFMASHAKQVVGVELNREATRDAYNNAKSNRVKNIRFVNQDATEYLEYLASLRRESRRNVNRHEASGEKDVITSFDVLCMDPPRTGSTPRFIKAVAALQIPKVVYISCGPDTLARDLMVFTKLGYKVDRITPVDMFPQTGHCETVALLTRTN